MKRANDRHSRRERKKASLDADSLGLRSRPTSDKVTLPESIPLSLPAPTHPLPPPRVKPKTSKKPRATTKSATAPQGITHADIAVAQAVLASRTQAAARGEDMEDLEDVVIARNVTLEDFARVPDEWIKGMKVALRTDGSLIAIDQFSMVCAATRLKVGKQVDNYAEANRGRGVYAYVPVPLDDDARITADAALYARTGDTDEPVAIAAFEVEGPHRSGPFIVENAARILNNAPTVECAVCIKFFYPRSRARQEVNEVCVPALLVIFRRCPPGPDRRLGRIELAEGH